MGQNRDRVAVRIRGGNVKAKVHDNVVEGGALLETENTNGTVDAWANSVSMSALRPTEPWYLRFWWLILGTVITIPAGLAVAYFQGVLGWK